MIFMGVGAMTDFGPLIANPKSALLGGRLGRPDGRAGLDGGDGDLLAVRQHVRLGVHDDARDDRPRPGAQPLP